MNRTCCLAVIVLALALAAPAGLAQVDYEPFTKIGTPIPGWTHHVAAWTVKDIGGNDLRAESTGTAGHTYLVRTQSAASIGVVEAKLTGVTFTCNGGVVFRFDQSVTNGIRAYGASSGGQNAYKVLILDAPGVSRTLVSLPTRPKNLICRLLVQGTEARAQFDIDPLDGKWDNEFTLNNVPLTGAEYGLYAWHGSYGDDVKFFDAAIFRRSTFGKPNLGQPVPLDLYAPTPNAPYILVPSFSKGMIGLPNGWFIPVTPDLLSVTAPAIPSIFANFSGFLSGTGVANAKVNVPNVPGLAGLHFYVAGAVIDTRLSPPFLHLSNEERIDLIP
jgi:hypothetical protein